MSGGFCGPHRLPRARLDPIDSPLAAMSTISALMCRPPRPETIVIALDDQRCGLAVIVVTGTVASDSFIDVIDSVGQSAGSDNSMQAVVVASIRPGDGIDAGDVDRWLEASAMLDERGVELVEWFVVGDEVCCPRDLLGERPRWNSQ